MKETKKTEDDFVLTFADFKKLAQRNKKTIFLFACLFAFLALFYGLTKPVLYFAEGTFLEKNKNTVQGPTKGLADLLLSSGGKNSDNNTLMIMESRAFLEKLTQRAGLQAMIVFDESSWSPNSLWRRIKSNIKAEYADLARLKYPLTFDQGPGFKVLQVEYRDEVPVAYLFKPISATMFSIKRRDGEEVCQGVFGQPCQGPLFSIVVEKSPSHELEIGKQYLLTIEPLGMKAEELGNSLKVDYAGKDKQLIEIGYFDSDRHTAKNHIDLLMSLYQDHLKEEQEKLYLLQVGYLEKRKTEIIGQLKESMDLYAKELSADIEKTGFTNTEMLLEFFVQIQSDFTQRLFRIDLDIQQLEQVLVTESEESFDLATAIGKFQRDWPLAKEVQSLKQTADALHLAVRTDPLSNEVFLDSFPKLMQELDQTQQSIAEVEYLLQALEENRVPEPPKSLTNKHLVVRSWYDLLSFAQKQVDYSPEAVYAREEWTKTKMSFKDYLLNLLHYFHVYSRNLEERLTYQQAPTLEFQGINLETAKALYLSYHNDLKELNVTLMHNDHILKQINQPDFQISSLTAYDSKDTITKATISKAGDVTLSLYDSDNQGSKEQQRLKEEIKVLQAFLASHLEQTMVLTQLKKQEVEEKIKQLQGATLILIQEQLAILEYQARQQIMSKLQDLRLEKKLLEESLQTHREEMICFPHKWIAEQMIEQEMEMNQHIVEDIAEMVESKTISSNLEAILSSPLDSPLTPINPVSPRLTLLFIIGAILGAGVGYTYVIVCSISRGIPASPENLQASGLHFAGSFSTRRFLSLDTCSDADLNVLRRLLAIINGNGIPSHSLLLLGNQGPNYATSLAELLFRKGRKVIVLDLWSDDLGESQEGIFPYLEGKLAQLPCQHKEHYDYVASGQESRYASELVGSERFKVLMAELEKQYDWVIVNSRASFVQAESEGVSHLFSCVAITVHEESLQQVQQYARLVKQKQTCLAFLFV